MSSHTDVPCLNLAVEHLQELGDRMRHDFGFEENDVNNIDVVIAALRDLEVYRIDAHTRLEAETIRASIQRHRLQFLPQQIDREIKEAVRSAQKSNIDTISTLKTQLKSTNENTAHMETVQKVLDEENAKLHPERERVQQLHEEIISQLNQRMADKASMQIELNETRDKVRQTNQEIVDLEDGILQLKEDLINERTEARTEKRTLKKAVASTTEKTKEQKLVNVEKKTELDEVHGQLQTSESKLDALRKSLRRYETNKAKLEGQERALTAQLQKQLKQNVELKKKGEQILEEDARLQREFIENEKQLTNKMERLDVEIGYQTIRFEELDTDRCRLAEELEVLIENRKDDAERVADLDAVLQNEKRNLSTKAEEVGDLQGQNTQMQEEIEFIGESHKLVMAQLNKQLVEYREMLAKERKERIAVQDRKMSVGKELEDFKLENQRFMQEMNNTITQGKQDHIALSNEGAQLQRELREDENEIKDLEDKLEIEQKKYEESFTKRQKEVDTMEREIIDMENTVAEKKQKIEDITPGFEELEVRFEGRTNAYEQQRKDMVELKGKKNTLEDKIVRCQDKKERLLGPTAKLQTDIKQKRHEAMFQLKHCGEETRALEADLYVNGCKLKTIMDENKKLEEGCADLLKQIDEIQYQMDYNVKMKERLLNELANTKAMLEKSWQQDQVIQEEYSHRDQKTVDELGNLLDRTVKREEKISSITGTLETELGYLSAFLDNLASRRPKGPRKGNKPPISFRSIL